MFQRIANTPPEASEKSAEFRPPPCEEVPDARLFPRVPTLGEIIKAFREERNLSQSRFAVMAEVEAQTISNIETGRTKRLLSRQFETVAKAMGMTAADLVAKTRGETEPPTEEALMIPTALAALIRERAKADGVKVADLLATWIATTRPKRKRGA